MVKKKRLPILNSYTVETHLPGVVTAKKKVLLLSLFINNIALQTIPPDHEPNTMTLCNIHV